MDRRKQILEKTVHVDFTMHDGETWRGGRLNHTIQIDLRCRLTYGMVNNIDSKIWRVDAVHRDVRDGIVATGNTLEQAVMNWLKMRFVEPEKRKAKHTEGSGEHVSGGV